MTTETWNQNQRLELYKSGSVLRSSRLLSLPCTRTGFSVPNWRQKISTGRSATGAFSCDVYKVVDLTPGYAQIRIYYASKPSVVYDVNFLGFEGGVDGGVNHIAGSFNEANNIALSRLHRKIRAQTSQFNGLTTLAESNKAIKGLMRPYSTMYKGLNRYFDSLSKTKRGLTGSPSKKRESLLSVAAGAWAETQFGLKPTLSDAQDIAETITRNSGLDFHRSSVRSYEEVSIAATPSYTVRRVDNTELFVLGSVINKTSYGVLYNVGMRSDLYSPEGSLARLRELSGLTLENFVPTAYELIPYSWLADYFTNIGDIIEAGTTDTSRVTWLSKTTIQKTSSVRYLKHFVNVPFLNAYNLRLKDSAGWGLGSVSLERKTVSRSIPSALGVPSLSFSLPGGLVKPLNVLAVLASKNSKTLRF